MALSLPRAASKGLSTLLGCSRGNNPLGDAKVGMLIEESGKEKGNRKSQLMLSALLYPCSQAHILAVPSSLFLSQEPMGTSWPAASEPL